jgi:hypothetical protein
MEELKALRVKQELLFHLRQDASSAVLVYSPHKLATQCVQLEKLQDFLNTAFNLLM